MVPVAIAAHGNICVRDTNSVFIKAVLAITKHVLSSRNACVGCCKPTEILASERHKQGLHLGRVCNHKARNVKQECMCWLLQPTEISASETQTGSSCLHASRVCNHKAHIVKQECKCLGLVKTIHIPIYTVNLAGKSPIMRSYTVYIVTPHTVTLRVVPYICRLLQADGCTCIRETQAGSSCKPCLQSQSTYCQAGMHVLAVASRQKYLHQRHSQFCSGSFPSNVGVFMQVMLATTQHALSCSNTVMRCHAVMQ
jgi:hypothetical protein